MNLKGRDQWGPQLLPAYSPSKVVESTRLGNYNWCEVPRCEDSMILRDFANAANAATINFTG
jgi:hypothetical protein